MKTFKIIENGKTISKHKSFWHAQDYSEKLLRENRITNDYEILPIEFESKEDYYKSMGVTMRGDNEKTK